MSERIQTWAYVKHTHTVGFHLHEVQGQAILNYDDKNQKEVAPVVKNLPASSGDARDVGSIPGLGRSPGLGNGNPLHYSCLENPMDRRP